MYRIVNLSRKLLPISSNLSAVPRKGISTTKIKQRLSSTPVLITIGSTATLTGTLMLAKYNEEFRNAFNNTPIKNLFDHLYGKQKYEIQFAEYDKLEQIVQDITEGLVDNMEVDIKTSMDEIYTVFETAFIETMTRCSETSQNLRQLDTDIANFNVNYGSLNSEMTASVLVEYLRLVERNKSMQSTVNNTYSTVEANRNLLVMSQNALTDLKDKTNEGEINTLLEKMENMKLQLVKSEEILKETVNCKHPHSVLRNYGKRLTDRLQREFNFSAENLSEDEAKIALLHFLRTTVEKLHKEAQLNHEHYEEIKSNNDKKSENEKLNALLDAQVAQLNHILNEEIQSKLSQVKRKLDHEVKDKIRTNKIECDEKIKKELEKKKFAFGRELNEQYELAASEINKRKQALIDYLYEIMIPNLDSIELQLKRSSDALTLFSLSYKLNERLNTDPFPPLNWKHQIQPIFHIIDTFYDTNVAKLGNFVDITLSQIPSEALRRGIYTLQSLKNRFHDVEKRCRTVALLHENDNNGLFLYIWSYLRSMLLVYPLTQVTLQEINNEPLELDKLNNDEILDRARFFLEQGDLRQTVGYMNLLRGVASQVSKDWIEEARLSLEIQQISQVLIAYSQLQLYHNIAQSESTIE